VSSNIKSRYGRKRTVTQINDNQFIVEGDSGFLRIGFEVDPSSPTYADFEGGPFLHIGYDFFGKGRVTEIQIIDSDREDYAIIKVTLENN
jgi:hypothetical protein